MQSLDVTLYRYDWFGPWYAGEIGYVGLREFKPLRATRTGWWVYDDRTGRDRIVYGNTDRAFAYVDKAKALNSYLIRKNKYVQRCRSRLEDAETALSIGEAIKNGQSLDEANAAFKATVKPAMFEFTLGDQRLPE